MADKIEFNFNEPMVKKIESVKLNTYNFTNKYKETIVSTVLLLVVLFATFISSWRLGADASWQNLSVMTALICMCSYMVYILQMNKSQEQGHNECKFVDADAENEQLNKLILEKKFKRRAFEFCNYKIEQELKHQKSNILLGIGISYDEYLEKYQGKSLTELADFEELSAKDINTIVFADAIKPADFEPDSFLRNFSLSKKGAKARSLSKKSPEAKKNINKITKLVSTVLISLFCASIVADFATSFSVASFCLCLIRLATIMASWVSGSMFGYSYAIGDELKHLQWQNDTCKELIQFCEENPSIKNSENKIEN